MTWLSNPRIFIQIITVLFAMSAIRNSFALDWAQVWYAVGAVVLNLSVMTMGAK
jgi:hypothetical protein